MKLILTSILFGILVTVALLGTAYGIAMIILFLETYGKIYALLPIVAILSIGSALAYYFGNR